MNSNESTSTDQGESLISQFKSLNGAFWLAGSMEIIERFSYFGARVALPIFMVSAIGSGGPELTQIEKGQIFGIWAVVQSFVPILSGGFADRYGYKINIAISTFLKLIGYLVMAFCIPLAELFAGMPLEAARAKEIDCIYEVLFAGSILVALGTAIFKPGIGGLISSQLNPRNSALGWSVFYQLVNVGGFVGPLCAGALRVIDWHYVFILCGAAISVNFFLLRFIQHTAAEHTSETPPGPIKMFYQSICGLLEPKLFFFTLSFAGFWLMTFQIFDILPNFIDDWIDSRGLADALKSIFGQKIVPTVGEGNLTQEWIINFNALLISIATFMMGYMTRRMKPLVTSIIGIFLAIFATYGLGMNMSGWWILGCILLFSFGEMMSGPANSYFIISIAPKGKNALYIGFSGFAVGIGWSVGSIIASRMYQSGGDKVVLAKRYLIDKLNIDPKTVDALPKEKVMPLLSETTNLDSYGATKLLWNTYEPYSMWLVFALIGLVSLIILCIYNRVTQDAVKNPNHPFNHHGHTWVLALLIPITMTFATCTYFFYSLALLLNFLFFFSMLIIALLPKHMRTLKM
jgi:proton-dependent oligopeptide transporter, POT family